MAKIDLTKQARAPQNPDKFLKFQLLQVQLQVFTNGQQE